jgi:MFS family permease
MLRYTKDVARQEKPLTIPAAQTPPAQTPPAQTQAAQKPFGWRFTFPLLLGSTLNPINSSMIATGLVGIAADFHTGPGATANLVSVLYLCSAVAQPTMGKLSTLFGPRRVFLVGVAILLAGGVLGGAAPGFDVLLASRALIGIGTSACYPTAMALVRRRADRAGVGVPSRVLGNFSIAAQITAVFGLPAGGVLAGAFGWRALFLVNVPFALITLAFAFFAVEKDPPRHREGLPRTVSEIDLPGIALFGVVIVSLLLFLGELSRPRWWLLALTATLTAALLLWERRAPRPLIDVRMLAANGPLQRTYLRQTLGALGIYTSLYGASQWMQQAAGRSATAVGLILLPLSAISIVVARLASSKGWVRWPLVIGAGSLVVTGVVMLAMSASSGVAALVGMSTLFGIQQLRQSGDPLHAVGRRHDRHSGRVAAHLRVPRGDLLLERHRRGLRTARHRRGIPPPRLGHRRHRRVLAAADRAGPKDPRHGRLVLLTGGASPTSAAIAAAGG